MKMTAENLRAQKTDMFATHASLGKLQDYIDTLNCGERTNGHIIMGITINTVLEMLAQEVEKDEQS